MPPKVVLYGLALGLGAASCSRLQGRQNPGRGLEF